MSPGDWRPFGQEEDEHDERYDALHDGVPEWMRKALIRWQLTTLSLFFSSGDPQDFLHSIEQNLRCEIEMPGNVFHAKPAGFASAVVDHFEAEDAELVLTDYIVSLTPAALDEDGRLSISPNGINGKLEEILIASGSMWTVGLRSAGKLGLIQRVSEGLQVAATSTMATSGQAGRTLGLAWGAAFGMNPNPREAYRLAIEAVEDAAIPGIGMDNPETQTLGKVIIALNGRDYEASNWTLPFQRDDKNYSNGKTIVAMLKTLWAGQVDRHGGDHEQETKMAITQEAAESAVMLAVPLVYWFTTNSVTKRTED